MAKAKDRNNFLFGKALKKDAEVVELMDVMLEEGKKKTTQISLDEPADYDPNTNHDVISLVKQSDGNWKGYMHKNGAFIEVRDVGPETVLQRLLTHE